jgi:hypothetical protein
MKKVGQFYGHLQYVYCGQFCNLVSNRYITTSFGILNKEKSGKPDSSQDEEKRMSSDQDKHKSN